MNKFGSTLRGADSLESSTCLLMGFVGGLLVVAVRKSLEGSRNEAGINVKVVSSRLGHANVAFTLTVYSHVIPEMDETAAETFATFMGGPVEWSRITH
jgi:hypothetical protein